MVAESPDLQVCDNCAEAGEPGYVHSVEWNVLASLERLETKLDALVAVLNEYRPLLEEASRRLGKGPRWGRGTRGTTETTSGS